jgi:predicted house-cleaning noncanonical NTP pyrophosphatase (MazG superfamily)
MTKEPRLSSVPSGYVLKLVRDGYLGRRSPGLRFESVASRDEHVRLLRQKLIEEVGEYLTTPCAGELADVYAVLRALAEVDLGSSADVIGSLALEKHKARGGFEKGTVMIGEPLPDHA